MDIQALSPAIIDLRPYIPTVLVRLQHSYINTFHDNLMRRPPLFLVAAILCELFLQLPFFFAAIIAFIKGQQYIRIPSIIYCSHVVTTVIMILPELYIRCTHPNSDMKLALVALYSIYLFIPLLLLWRVCREEQIFESSSESITKATKKIQ